MNLFKKNIAFAKYINYALFGNRCSIWASECERGTQPAHFHEQCAL